MKINKPLLTIIFFGIVVRLYLIFTKNVFTDEVFYFRVVRDFSSLDFIHITHWIKDHAILHFIVLKVGMIFTSRIAYLRLINILYYVGSAHAIYLIFKSLKLGRWSLLPVFFFSIHGYFIYIASMILPYNIVIFFTLLSIYYCLRLFVVEGGRVGSDYITFILFTTLAFYSDYSFFSMFLFYAFILVYVFLCKRSRRIPLVLSYGVIVVLVLPGISQLIDNLPEIQRLNTSIVRSQNLLPSFQQFCSMTILHDQPTLSFLIYIFYLALFISSLTFIFYIRKKRESVHNFFSVIGISYYISTIAFLLIHQYIFPIFVERAAWFFPLFALMMISLLVVFNFELKKKLFLFILILFLTTRLLNLFVTNGDITYEVSYKSFLQDYAQQNTAKEDDYLFIIDSDYVLFPLRYYYLSPKHSIFNTALDEKTKKLLKEKRPTVLYLKTSEVTTHSPQLPKATDYSVVLPTCEVSNMFSDIFIKNANTIYCLEYIGDKKYTFIKMK